MSEIKFETASAGGGGGGSGTVTSVAVNTGTAGTDVNRTGSPITTSGTIVINIPVASATNTGKLSNTDWSTFNGKQALLVSGSNIRTVNGNTLLGSTDIAVQAVLISGSNIRTINGNTLLGSTDIAVQAVLLSGANINTINGASILGPGNTQLQVPLVSAVNIKTVNGNSLLGSGDLVISGGGGTPAGSTGQVQFNNAGAFGADADLFWDNINKRAGFGISTGLGARLSVKGTGTTSATFSVNVTNGAGTPVQTFYVRDDGQIGNYTPFATNFQWAVSTVDSEMYIQRQGTKISFTAGSGGNSAIVVSNNQPFLLSNSVSRFVIGNGGFRFGDAYGTPNAGAQVDIVSTTKGILPPRTTTASIAAPAQGMFFYDTGINKLRVYNGTAWETITSL
jgi:hypothetical protein